MKNAKDTPLNQVGSVPNLSTAILGWLQKMTIGKVTKTTVNFKVVEAVVDVETKAMIQPMSAQSLKVKPEGQRSWPWYTLHCIYEYFDLDDVIVYNDVRYRVMAKHNYKLYGYMEYEIVEGFKVDGD